MAYLQWMITNASMLVITIIAMIGNGSIAFLVLLRPALRNKSALYLVVALTMTNFILCVISLPYVTILVVGLKSGEPMATNFSAAAIIYSSTPFIGGTMVTSVLTLGIAWDRLHALLRPVSYRKVNHKLQMITLLIIGIILGLIVMAINLITGDVHRVNPGCAAGGCFWDIRFRIFWTVCAVVLNSMTTFCTIALMVKIRQHQKLVSVRRAEAGASTEREERAFMRANVVAIYVLVVSTIFVTVPFLVNGISTIAGPLVYKEIGPFVAYGVFCAAACNFVVHGYKQKDIREHLMVICGIKQSARVFSERSEDERARIVRLSSLRNQYGGAPDSPSRMHRE